MKPSSTCHREDAVLGDLLWQRKPGDSHGQEGLPGWDFTKPTHQRDFIHLFHHAAPEYHLDSICVHQVVSHPTTQLQDKGR